MRLDRYLKISQLIKRRMLAKEVSDQGRTIINSSVIKVGSDIRVEDVLAIRFGQKLVTVEVTVLDEHVFKDNVKGMYEIIEERRPEET